jgi:hypothetical protein
MPDNTTIRLTTIPDSSQEVWIVRDSSANGRLVDYASGATVSESTLDLDGLQAYYLFEENTAIGELVSTESSDKNYFGNSFDFVGDGVETDFTLTGLALDLAEISIWAHINGLFSNPADFSVAQDTAEQPVITFATPPSNLDDIHIRVAQQTSLAINLEAESVDTTELADGSVTEAKLGLDGMGTNKQVLGFDPTTELNNVTLDHSWMPDFDTGVRENSLDQMATAAADVAMGGNKITGLAAGTVAGDAVRFEQLASVTSSDRFEVDVNITSFPHTVASGLNDGVYYVCLRMENVATRGSSDSYTTSVTVNSVQRDQLISNFPDGAAPVTFPMLVTVSGGSITINSVSDLRSFQGGAGFRIALS